MLKLFAIVVVFFSICELYAQTEQDYFERYREFRERRKISKITTDNYIDSFDVQGNLVKRTTLDNTYLISGLKDGNIVVEFNSATDGYVKQTVSLALFYHTNLDPFSFYDNVKLSIDPLNRILEETLTGVKLGSDHIYYYYEILKQFPNRSEYYNNNTLLYRTKYFYDGKGLLLKEEIVDEITGRSYFKEYSYEFYE